jgi:hypothetical protein
LEKRRADEGEYAQFVKDNVAVAPIYSGLDGGMNKVFVGRFPGRYVSFAKVLPPTGPQLPQLPPVPWADSDSSLTSRFFGGLFGSKADARAQVVATDLATQKRGAGSAPAGPIVTPTTKARADD